MNDDGFLVWSSWLIVFEIDNALISIQQFKIRGQGMGGEKNWKICFAQVVRRSYG